MASEQTAKQTKSAAKPKKGKSSKSSANKGPIELMYRLDELPSAQHRAGLAGLALLVRWLKRQPAEAQKGVCEVVAIDEAGLTLRLDQDGLDSLLRQCYAAASTEACRYQPLKDRKKELITPLRIDEEEYVDKKTEKTKTRKRYWYPAVVPQGAFLEDLEPATPEGDKPWIKLWRDMLWSTLRGKPTTRGPYNDLAEGKAFKLSASVWKGLIKSGKIEDLPSTYFVGAQAFNAETVKFRDQARSLFLLHFWNLVANVYQPRSVKVDGKSEWLGYVVAIPDVSALTDFVEEFHETLRARSSEQFWNKPKSAVIDAVAEAALDLFELFRQRLIQLEGQRDVADLVDAVEVFHLQKQGNNINLRSQQRIVPVASMVDEYARVRSAYWSHAFRATRLNNILTGQDWHSGFGRVISTTSESLTIGRKDFRHDAREAFKIEGGGHMTEGSQKESQKKEKRTVEKIIYDLVGEYLRYKLRSKYELVWDKVSANESQKAEYSQKKQKLAREAFLASRSRTGEDFVSYFSASLCAAPQYLPERDYLELSQLLTQETERIRTLTLLALSAQA